MYKQAQGTIGAGKSARDLGAFGSPAQGTIEYLVILAVIVVVSLVVVSLMINSTAPAASVNEGQSQLYWESQAISITEAVADEEGDAILTLAPAENATITALVVDGQEIDVPDTKVFAGNEQTFLIEASIVCTGTKSTHTVTAINYIAEAGLNKTVSGKVDIVVECVQDVSSETLLSDDYVEHELYPDTIVGRTEWALLNGASGLNDVDRFFFDGNYGGYIDSNTGNVWLAKEAFGSGSKFCYPSYCQNLVQCMDGTFAKPDLNLSPACTPGCNVTAQGNCDSNGGVMFDDWQAADTAGISTLTNLSDMSACGWLCRYWGTDTIFDFSSGGWGCGTIWCSCGSIYCGCNESSYYYTCYR